MTSEYKVVKIFATVWLSSVMTFLKTINKLVIANCAKPVLCNHNYVDGEGRQKLVNYAKQFYVIIRSM